MGKILDSMYLKYLSIKGKIDYERDKKTYIDLCHGTEFNYSSKFKYPCYTDRYNGAAGSLDEHYFLQDIYMSSELIKSGTKDHFDIGSRIDGFIAHLLASGIRVTMLDIRPLNFEVDNLSFIQTDATRLENIEDNSIESISSLHAIEHFGLGRYGDAVDPEAWKKALENIVRVTKPGGKIYISVPIGTRNQLYFNAHRVFQINTIPDYIADHTELEKMSYIQHMKINEVDSAKVSKTIIDQDYLCGMYIFRKIATHL